MKKTIIISLILCLISCVNFPAYAVGIQTEDITDELLKLDYYDGNGSNDYDNLEEQLVDEFSLNFQIDDKETAKNAISYADAHKIYYGIDFFSEDAPQKADELKQSAEGYNYCIPAYYDGKTYLFYVQYWNGFNDETIEQERKTRGEEAAEKLEKMAGKWCSGGNTTLGFTYTSKEFMTEALAALDITEATVFYASVPFGPRSEMYVCCQEGQTPLFIDAFITEEDAVATVYTYEEVKTIVKQNEKASEGLPPDLKKTDSANYGLGTIVLPKSYTATADNEIRAANTDAGMEIDTAKKVSPYSIAFLVAVAIVISSVTAYFIHSKKRKVK